MGMGYGQRGALGVGGTGLRGVGAIIAIVRVDVVHEDVILSSSSLFDCCL